MRLGITTIVKNESLYIREWILFNFMQGVTEFFLYDNDSTDGLEEAVRRYPLNEISVKIIPWSGKCRHLEAYDHSIANHRKLVDWMAFIDVDEFLYSTEYPKVVKHLEVITAIDNYNIACVQIAWYIFGSSGHKEYSPELVLERFTHRPAELNVHSKSIIRMNKAVSTWKDTHTFKVRGRTLVRPPNLLINHYHVKSENEYRIRCAKGRGDVLTPRNFEETFPAHDINTVEDTYLKDTYADRLKALLY